MKKQLVSIIKENPEFFPANFQLIKKRSRVYSEEFMMKQRQINIEAYSSNDVIIDPFYKKISRTLIL